MVSSIDGRLLPERWTPPVQGVDGDIAHRMYEQVAAQFGANGWIVGRNTMAEFADGKARDIATHRADLRKTFVAERNGRDVAVAIDPSGKLHYGTDNFDGDHIVAVVGEGVSDAYLAELRDDGVSYAFAGPDGHDLHRAVRTLGDSFGLKTLLLEGGGRINGSFLKEGLIDEISLLVYPGIDGLSGIPSIFDFVGQAGEMPAAGRSLRHITTETLESGVVWIHYVVEPLLRSS
jgi:5-amino-6-(5-phosphoribosylamino)uracil reductase